jgi:hypothetical protein
MLVWLHKTEGSIRQKQSEVWLVRVDGWVCNKGGCFVRVDGWVCNKGGLLVRVVGQGGWSGWLVRVDGWVCNKGVWLVRVDGWAWDTNV